ncbi:sulfurtransferase [Massilia sp. CF038]|uniref:sulfurtransferase n=1 Tax=Massilia sp. CF038 TaxID=1881045 RepID=UPI001E4D1361|nr:rhodanese-like domain-containing protein [Massilia sp. CF038]
MDRAQYQLFEVGCGTLALFCGAHIPGAHWLDTARLESAPLYNKVSDAALLALLLELGIGAHSTLVLYGRNSLAAARAAHLMLYAGVRDVRLLDGGFPAWQAAGLPCVSGAPPAPLRCASFGAPFPACPHFLLDMAATRAARYQGGTVLVSIRTRAEFSGATSGYCYIDARGDIPGARWGHAGCEGDVDSMSDFQNADGCMRPGAQITRMWASNGIEPGRHVVFYCGTGWRASLAFFYAWLMGWDNIAVYDGGWYEWSLDPANPVLCRLDTPETA